MSYTCPICPHQCLIKDGRFGVCGVRGAEGNEPSLPFEGIVSSASVDPIEKKPLYHFHPSEKIFSVGFYGCNLSCPFCQNYRISKEFKSNHYPDKLSPSEIVRAAVGHGSFGIAYTYSEPIVHYEFVIRTAVEAHQYGLKNVLVTNGFIENSRGIELLGHMDAVNIDLKSFSDDFYRKELRGSLSPVLDFIRNAAERVHTEVTTLLINGKNDSIEEISEASSFLGKLDRNIPYHLSAYYPAYRYSTPATNAASVMQAAETAAENLNFVFTGNIRDGISDTHCPSCGNMLIQRSGYSTRIAGIRDGRCTDCGIEAVKLGIIL